jgi:Caspase domain
LPIKRANRSAALAGPIDDEDLWNYSLNLNSVVEGLRAQAPGATHYVVFDACRNELNLTHKGTKALSDKGFVPLAYTPRVMVAYATAPGQTAADVGSSGGPYAKALAEEIVKPGVEAMTMFRLVALRVNREIGQDPWMSASTLPEIYLAGQAAKPDAQSQSKEASREWSGVDKKSVVELETFIRRHGSSPEADYARAWLVEIKKQQGDAAKQAANQKSDEEALAKAEVERQRLAMLQRQQDEKRRAEAEEREATKSPDEQRLASLNTVEEAPKRQTRTSYREGDERFTRAPRRKM